MLLVIAVLLGWALLAGLLAVGCGRAFAAGHDRPMPTAAATDYELAA
jgi:hypothetical protein